MAKKAMILKQQAEAKYSSRRYNRCKICGRPHAYLRDYGVCRICFRELAYKGQIPGVRKASWEQAVFLRCLPGRPGASGCVPGEIVNVKKPGKSREDGAGCGPHSPDTPALSRVQPVTSIRRISTCKSPIP